MRTNRIKQVLINLSFIIYPLSVSVALSSCSSNDDAGQVSADYIKVNPVVIEGQATQGTLQIEADCSWTITTDASWVTVGMPQGEGTQNVTLTTGSNPSSVEERSCQLTVTSKGGVQRTVSVMQTRNNEELTVSATSLDFNTAGGELKFTITSNTQWTISGGADWLSVSDDSGTNNKEITVTAQANNDENARTASITVSGTNTSHHIAIQQVGVSVTLTVSPNERSADAKGSTYTFNVNCNYQWTVSSSVEGWVSFTPSSGSQDGQVSVTLTDNTNSSARSVRIIVKSGASHTEECVITQAGATPPELNLPSYSAVGRYEFTVSTSFSSPLDITECGFCYSETTEAPTVSNTNVPASAQGTNGDFSLKLDNLKSGHTYHVRAWARNANGIGYSQTVSVKTEGNVPGEEENTPPNL